MSTTRQPDVVSEVGEHGHRTHVVDEQTGRTLCGDEPSQVRLADPYCDPTCMMCRGALEVAR